MRFHCPCFLLLGDMFLHLFSSVAFACLCSLTAAPSLFICCVPPMSCIFLAFGSFLHCHASCFSCLLLLEVGPIEMVDVFMRFVGTVFYSRARYKLIFPSKMSLLFLGHTVSLLDVPRSVVFLYFPLFFLMLFFLLLASYFALGLVCCGFVSFDWWCSCRCFRLDLLV
jgi:hypothetical protein